MAQPERMQRVDESTAEAMLKAAGGLARATSDAPAELRLAEALLDNDVIEIYAQKQCVSRNTVRTHLVSLFVKTGTKRQAELASTLLASRPHVLR